MPRHFLHQNRPEKPKNIKRDPVASGERDASVNRAASHNYFLLEKYEAGMMLIPLRIYFKGGKAKCELAVARGKQLWDKRETERRKTADAEARAAIARGRRR